MLFFPAGQVWACGDLSNQSTLTCRLALAQVFTDGLVGFCICFVVCLIFGCIFSLCAGDDALKAATGIATVVGVTIVFTSLLWWIVNIVRNATNATTDSNGVAGTWY